MGNCLIVGTGSPGTGTPAVSLSLRGAGDTDDLTVCPCTFESTPSAAKKEIS
jgi:hypothetical protein